jgi:hypothetical protein
MRHLRVLYYGSDGKELSQSPLSSARMPAFVIQATRMPALVYLRSGAESRRTAAAATLLEELKQKKPRFAGVAFMSCPSLNSETKLKNRSTKSAYLVSFVAITRTGDVTRSDLAAQSYAAVRRMLSSRMKQIITSRGRQSESKRG